MNFQRAASLAVAASMLIGNVAMAQDRDHGPDRRDGPQTRQGPDRRPPPPPPPPAPRRDERRDLSQRDHGRHHGRDHRHDMARRDDGRGAGPDHSFRRGGRLPPQYRSRSYVVEDWRGHRLSAPPRGYHWVQTGPDYVLAAIATGIIAQIILSQ